MARTRPWFVDSNLASHDTTKACSDTKFVLAVMRAWQLQPGQKLWDGQQQVTMLAIKIDDTAIQGFRPTLLVRYPDGTQGDLMFWSRV